MTAPRQGSGAFVRKGSVHEGFVREGFVRIFVRMESSLGFCGRESLLVPIDLAR